MSQLTKRVGLIVLSKEKLEKQYHFRKKEIKGQH